MAPIAASVYRAVPEEGLPSLTDAIAAASACKLEVHDEPTTRVLHNFAAGRLDVILIAIQTNERDKVGDFIPGGSSPWVLVTRRADANAPQRIEEFAADRQLLLGVARGAAYPIDVQTLLDQMKSNGQIDETADFGMALTKLANGRDAAVLMVADAYAALIAATGDSRFQPFLQPRLTASMIGTYLSRQSLAADDRAALRTGLHRVMENGVADRLLQAHVPALSARKPH